MTDDSKYRAPALDKGLEILELLASCDEPQTQKSICSRLGRSPSEIYRMLATLISRGYVTRSATGEHYSLSLKMFSISQSHPPLARLTDFAKPQMAGAARRWLQSCHLGVENNGEIVVVAVAESPSSWGLSLKTGASIGLWNTGTGCVIAAFCSETERKELVLRHQRRAGEPALDEGAFAERIQLIRKQGYEIRRSDEAKGIVNIAFPIFNPLGRAAAAISCPYVERLDAQDSVSLEDVKSELSDLAARLTSFCGGSDMLGQREFE